MAEVIIRRIDSFSSLKDEWNVVLETAGTNTVFQTYEWLSTWWEYFGQGKELLLLVANKNDNVVGIAPLMIMKMRVKGLPFYRVANFIGSGTSDYLDFILKKGCEKEVLSEIIDYLKKHRKNWDLMRIGDIPDESLTNMFLPNILGQKKISFHLGEHDTCPYVELPETWQDYKLSLSRSTRKNIVKFQNRIAEKAEFRTFKGESEVSTWMDNFFKLHEERWRREGDRAHIRSKEFKQFHREVAIKLTKYLDLSFLFFEGKEIAALYCYDYNTTRGFYLQGFDPDYAHYSPAFVLTANRIEDAIQRGLKKFDFLRGDEPYKYHFTKTQKINKRYYISHSRMKLVIFQLIEWMSKKIGS